jgi:hypothetical protein
VPAARVLVAVLLVAAAPARGERELSLVPELTLAAGWDSNLFLDANPAGVPASQVRSDAIIDIQPRLVGRLSAGAHTLTLRVEYLERLTPSTGDLRDLQARLDWATPLAGPLQGLLNALYEHYEAAVYPDETFDLGGFEAGARVHASNAVRVQALYRFDARAYPDPARGGQRDLEQLASASLRARVAAPLTLELTYAFLHIASSSPTTDLDRHRGELALWLRPVSWLSVAASYGFAFQRLPGGALDGSSRDDLQHALTAVVTARVARWVELFARYDLLSSTSSDAAGDYARHRVLAGVSGFVELRRGAPRPAPSGAPITFRLRARAAREVSLIGDWNGWQPAPLIAVGGGRFERVEVVPPGRHQYTFLVDGVATPPPDAAAYVDDGLGGKNALLEVYP